MSGAPHGGGRAPKPSPRRSARAYLLGFAGGLLLALGLSLAGLMWYSSTARFAAMVQKKVVAVLEDATGGRVEIQSVRWNPAHLAVEVNDLTIHGLEAPGEVPYAHVDRLSMRVKILSFLQPRIGLNFLEADHPVLHLILYPDGATNQPRPKKAAQNPGSLTDTIFDLRVDRTEVNHGLALINQRAIPFHLAANGLSAVVTYVPATDRYLGRLRVADLTAQRGRTSPIQSRLDLDFALARNRADLEALRLSGGGLEMDASGSLTDFMRPRWSLSARGVVDLREVAALAATDGLGPGTAELQLQGRGSGAASFVVEGNVKLVGAGYRAGYLAVDGLNAAAHLRVTPEEIALTDGYARLRQGGRVEIAARCRNWRTPAPVGSIRARLDGVRLQTVLQMVAERRYQDLGFDTEAAGSADVDWTRSAATLTAGVKLQLSPPSSPSPAQAPLRGTLDARYVHRSGTVQIALLQARTAATSLAVGGSLGVFPLSRPSSLQVHFKNSSLAEFDRLLIALGLTRRGQGGISAIPARLHGSAEFDGSVNGSLLDPDIQGHWTVKDFSTDFGAPVSGLLPAERRVAPVSGSGVIRWDRLDARIGYSSRLISVSQAVLTKGSTVIHAAGELRAHSVANGRGVFDANATIDASAGMENASLTDILAIAGESLPMSGAVSLRARAAGSLGNLSGGGTLTMKGGKIAGESYRTMNASWTMAGHDVHLTSLALALDGGRVAANGNYNLPTKAFLLNVDGAGFDLAHIPRLQRAGYPVAGLLKFDAHASGTLDSPSVLAGVHLTNLRLRGQPLGELHAVAHTQGGATYFSAQSNLAGADLQVVGRTVLRKSLPTEAKVVVSHLNVDPLFKMFNLPQLSGNSMLGGTLSLAGPAREPERIGGEAEIDQFSITLQGLALKNQGPVLASLRAGVFHLTQARITGPDTNVTITGTAGFIGEHSLDMTANGSVNMRLARTFDPDIVSSGHVDFNLVARGAPARPVLTGQVRLADVALALNDLPTGISKLNGTLVFDQNRLEVRDLSGATGGGQLKLGGFLTYQQGIYGDLTATGKDIRVRYSGVSATADTTLHLQGSQANMLLRGNVQITRFVIGQNLDLARFAGPPVATPPPNLDAPSNHVRLDVHITSSPQLDFQNSYAQLAGGLDLHVRGTIAQPALLGHINITEGTATFAGTTYQLQRGDVYFTNPVRIDPVVDIDAATRIDEYDVTIGLHGNASQLTPTFRSDPPLPQADVVSLLALGRTQEEQQTYSQEDQTAGVNSTSNALLGGALNAAVGSRMEKLFGGGVVKIDPTYVGNLGDASARITVQQNIARNIQLTYATNVNTTAEQLIQAQVNLTENISVLAVRDESDVFSLVLMVHKRFR